MAKNFPDLTGDGRVTRADVLKGRGVFKHGGSVRKMARGGALPKGPQGPRRSPQQTRFAQKQRDILQQMRDDEMSRRTREAYEEAMRESTSGMKHGGKVKNMRQGGSPVPAPKPPVTPRSMPPMLSKAKNLATGAVKRLASGPVGQAMTANDLYRFAKDVYDNARQYEQGGYGEMPEAPFKRGGKVKGKKVKKFQAGGMTLGGIPVGPAADPNAPVQGGFGTPFMPSVPVQQRQLGGTPGLTPPTVPNMGIAPGAFGGTPGLELPTVPVQPRPPMGRARPMPVPVRRPMPVRRRGMNEGGSVKKYAAGGSISSASRRADGIARKGKTRGKMC